MTGGGFKPKTSIDNYEYHNFSTVRSPQLQDKNNRYNMTPLTNSKV